MIVMIIVLLRGLVNIHRLRRISDITEHGRPY